MCTALSLQTVDHYFGRTLDLDRSYGEEVCVMPRRYPLCFRATKAMDEHHAIIGMSTVVDGCPLFYEGANEYGLGMAGLNFPGNAFYGKETEGKDNVASFEFIPWILGQCKTVAEARVLLGRIHLTDTAFAPNLAPSPLHWMICDKDEAVVVESMKDGLHIHDNPVGVMTNNPPFPHQLEHWRRYGYLRNDNRDVVREEGGDDVSYCQGLGGVGLPGDLSSMSRFVRAAFGRSHSACEGDEASSVEQFFHLMDTVSMTRGLCRTDEGGWDITGYTACINTRRGLYYYTTYGNRRISCVDLHRTDLNAREIHRFPLRTGADVAYQN